jgi:hypothetical protein
MKDHPTFVFGDHLPALGNPAIARGHHGFLGRARALDATLGEGLVDSLPGPGDLAPKISAIGSPMRPPQRVMVWMILLLTSDVFLRPTPRHVHAIGPE